MPALYGFLLVVFLLVLLLMLVSRRLKSTIMTGAVVAVAAGVLLSTLHIVEVGDFNTNPGILLRHFTENSLAVGLMGAALSLSPGYLSRHWKMLALLLVVFMAGMWLMSTLLTQLVFDLPLLVALLVGAIITPTDPVLASTILTGQIAQKFVPREIRNMLTAESVANDGLAFLFVLLPLLLMKLPAQQALIKWLTDVLLYQVIGATALGGLIGFTAAFLLGRATQFNWIVKERTYLHTYAISLALIILQVARLINVDSFLAVFAAAVVFGERFGRELREDEKATLDAINWLFFVPTLVLFGMALPWQAWADLGWRSLVFPILILLLRRPPVAVVSRQLFKPLHGSWPQTLFVGWFGPVGISALYYATLSMGRVSDGLPLWNITSLVIFASVLVHGVTSLPLSTWLGRVTGTYQPPQEKRQTEAEQEPST